MKKSIRRSSMWTVATLLVCSNPLFATPHDVKIDELMHDVGVLKGIYDDCSKQTAAHRLRTVAERDSIPYAMNVLGLLYMNGTAGIGKDTEQAVYWLERAGEKGFSDAYHNLGMIYKQGRNGIAQNFNAAYENFRKGAEQGSVACMYGEGFMLYKGLGCHQDYAKALAMFQTASDSGNVFATYMLGLCYRNGYGTSQDEEKGMEILKKSANLGYSAAIEEMTRPYPENCLKDISVIDSHGEPFPVSMPEIRGNVNDTTFLKGSYKGSLVMYDWSKQYVLGDKPAALSLARIGDEVSGVLILGVDSIPFTADITAEGMLEFKEGYVNLKERYTFSGKVKYKLCQAALDIWNDRICGSLSLYSMKEHEPEHPIYVELYREGTHERMNYNQEGAVNISPNPFDTEFCTNFELRETANATARIFNKQGMLVWQQSLGTLEKGKHTVKLYPDVRSGHYVLNISAGRQVLRTIIIKN